MARRPTRCPVPKCGIGAEAALPERMAQQHDAIFAELVLARQKRAAQRRLHSEDVEVVRRDTRGWIETGSSPPVNVARQPASAAMYSKTVFCFVQSR